MLEAFVLKVLRKINERSHLMNWKALFKTKSIADIQKEAEENLSGAQALRKTLGVWDLTALGVAAVLGAGAFSTLGNAASSGGPAVIFLFIFTAVACAFSALCYAEFASVIPVAGSAYTYAYASFGEMIAWIIGWDLLIEYAIGNIACAISWSQYFVGLLAGYGVSVPKYFTMDFISAKDSFRQIQTLLDQGQTLTAISQTDMSPAIIKGYCAWLEAPIVWGIPIVCDLPALLITILITWIVFIGIEESKLTSNVLVLLKVFIVLLVICVGATYVNPDHWVPFAPNGAKGVLKGVSGVFFAYIGFDAISTTAEECRNPQRDLPRGMIYSLVICTVLYVLVALVLTGMVDYRKLGVGDPLAFVFGPEGVNLPWVAGVIDIIAVVALSTVLLVFQVGQPRIWMAMSRDGLLPPIFSSIHKKYKTPWFSTLLTGVVVAIPSLFMNLKEVTDLTSIGTLFAFILVCGGILKIGPQPKTQQKFKTPYINGKYIFPILIVSCFAAFIYFRPEETAKFFTLSDDPAAGLSRLDVFAEKIPLLVFCVEMLILSVLTFVKNLSLVPLLGLSTCSYLMTELEITNWLRFGIWLIVGFFVYFLYGIKHSRLRLREKSLNSATG